MKPVIIINVFKQQKTLIVGHLTVKLGIRHASTNKEWPQATLIVEHLTMKLGTQRY
jgi:hypothetical protein